MPDGSTPLYAKSRELMLKGIDTHQSQVQIGRKLHKILEGSFSPLPKEVSRRQQQWLDQKLDSLKNKVFDRIEPNSGGFRNLTEELECMDLISPDNPPSYLDIQNYTLSPDEVFSAFIRISSLSSGSSSLTYEVFIQGALPENDIHFSTKPILSFTVPHATSLLDRYQTSYKQMLQTSWLRWSPDSRSLALLCFNERMEPNICIFSMGYFEKHGFLFFKKRVFNADQLLFHVTKDEDIQTDFVWGPEGKKLFYIASDGFDHTIWEYDLTLLSKRRIFQTENKLYGLSWQNDYLTLFSYNQSTEVSVYCFLEDGELHPYLKNLPGQSCFAQWDPLEKFISLVVNASPDLSYLEVFDRKKGVPVSEMITDVYIPSNHRFYGAPFYTDAFVVYPGGGDANSVDLKAYSLPLEDTKSLGITPAFQYQLSELGIIRDRLYFRSMALQKDYFFQISSIEISMKSPPDVPPKNVFVHLDCISLDSDTLFCEVPNDRVYLAISKTKSNILECRACNRALGMDEVRELRNYEQSDNTMHLRYNADLREILARGVIHVSLKKTKANKRLLKKARKIKIVNGDETPPS